MRLSLYTIHTKRDQHPWPVADGFDWLALALPPFWAVWHGLWLVLVFQAGFLVLAGLYAPVAMLPVWLGLAVGLAFEGGAATRAELALRGWDEVATVEAGSEAGAEEIFLTGAGA